MSEAQGKVTALDGAYAIVATDVEKGCGRCHESGGCGGANISRMMCSSAPRTWRVLNPRGAKIGEEVTITVADGAIGAGAFVVYVVPLVLLLLGAIVGAWQAADGGAITGAVIGLIVGVLIMRQQQRRRLEDSRFQPHIV